MEMPGTFPALARLIAEGAPLSNVLVRARDAFDFVELTAAVRLGDEVHLEASTGMSDAELKRARYRLGEGVTGRVVQDGKPIAVLHPDDDERFLHRSQAPRADHAFICVPVMVRGSVLGALAADVALDVDTSRNSAFGLDGEVDRLTVLAGLLVPYVEQRRAQQLSTPKQPGGIVGRSGRIQEVFRQVAQVADSDTTVLIEGDSGTGKELVATALHEQSDRRHGPFVRLNCAALPDTLIESELFGHERGAFTGAHARRKGRFELAQGGTLFLDEIGDLALQAQAKLLRVLQERELERVGGVDTIDVDVRVVAATHHNLQGLVDDGRFRQDLFYRLHVFPIRVPKLNERPTDLPLLIDHFVEKHGRAQQKRVRRISTPAIDLLMAYHWPGNVRELENIIERAVLVTDDDVIRAHHLPPTLQSAESSGTTSQAGLQDRLVEVEREMIVDALKTTRGNCSKAAKQLGLTERVLGLRLKKHALDWRRFRVGRG